MPVEGAVTERKIRVPALDDSAAAIAGVRRR